MTNLKIPRKAFNDITFEHLRDYTHRYEVWYGGAGSGKSYGIVQKLIIKAITMSDRKFLIMRKVMATTRDSTWRLVMDMISKWGLYPLVSVNLSNYEIRFPSGSVFLFYGLDDPEKIKSISGITDIWCEEATEFTVDDISQLDLRLRASSPFLQFTFSFNPVSKANWVYERWFSGEAGDDTVIIKSTYKDNRFLPDSYIKTLEGMMVTNPTYYSIYALGEFASLDKLVYTNWEERAFDYTEIKGRLLIGLDFGFVTDTTALVASIMDTDRIYIFREWGDTGITNDGIAGAIRSLGFAKSNIVADSAEPKSIEEIKRLGIQHIKPSVKGPDSIIHGIQRLQQYRLIVHPDCREVLTELKNYSWKKDKKTGQYINEPVDTFNHYMDALRYSLQCYDTGRFRVTSKALLGL